MLPRLERTTRTILTHGTPSTPSDILVGSLAPAEGCLSPPFKPLLSEMSQGSWYEPAAVDVAHLKWLAQTNEDVLEPEMPISASRTSHFVGLVSIEPAIHSHHHPIPQHSSNTTQ